uniref:Uncharacterized protein n=1 Tax=Rhizophora mucronata TaxID=61149 RepID=A0A2P2IP05_RHIMU
MTGECCLILVDLLIKLICHFCLPLFVECLSV